MRADGVRLLGPLKKLLGGPTYSALGYLSPIKYEARAMAENN
jgi:hypothetical protein